MRRQLDLHHGKRLRCTDAQFIDTARTYWTRHAHTVRAIPRLTTLAREAATTGPVAIISANDGAIVRAGLTAINLTGLTTTIIAREDVPHSFVVGVVDMSHERS